MNHSEIMRHNEKVNASYRKAAKLSSDHISKIKKYSKTKIIPYKNMPEPFDYVDRLFPSAGVRNALVYETDRSFLDKLGYRGVGGFFTKIDKVIVIPDNLDFQSKEESSLWKSVVAKITRDEVLVHELLHFASNKQAKNTRSVQLEEEFAYGNSIAYLRSKGHSDEFIVDYNFLPYLMSVINKAEIVVKILSEQGVSVEKIRSLSQSEFKRLAKQFDEEIFFAAKEAAREIGRKIVSVYSPKEVSIKDIKLDDNSFDHLDL